VDQRLVDFAADLDWLKAQGVAVRRINLSQEPMEFVKEPAIKTVMDDSEGDDLPAILVGGRITSKARYPSRAELAAMAGIGGGNSAGTLEITEQLRELIALGAAIGASCEPCLKFHVKKSRDLGLPDAAIREAIRIGETVKEASGKNIIDLAGKLLPAKEVEASSCCGDGKLSAAPVTEKAAGGCCGGSKGAESSLNENAGSCC
jgi:AhpD family alkylhydroperoxidase